MWHSPSHLQEKVDVSENRRRVYFFETEKKTPCHLQSFKKYENWLLSPVHYFYKNLHLDVRLGSEYVPS